MVPQIIHQTWKTAKVDYWVFQRSQESVKKYLSHWTYRFWTDDDLIAFVRGEYPRFYGDWSKLSPHIKLIDVARYFLLHRHGGVYADLDFIFTLPIDDLLEEPHRLFFYRSHQAIVKGWAFLGNAWMASNPGENFWLDAVQYMLALPADTPVLLHTGPLALGAFYASLANPPPIRVFDPDVFDNERCADGVGLRQYGFHVRTATWQHPPIP